MLKRISLIALAVVSLTTSSAFAGRWDVALDGGWMRCLLDLDAQNSTVAARVYDTRPGGNLATIEDVVVANYPENYVLQGTITSGTFTIGMGGMSFGVGDRFYLFLSKFTGEILLVLAHDQTLFYSISLSLF
jgi:hypothetical protein